jgi:ATP-dependent Clp protease ATP-binding subunit ClpA
MFERFTEEARTAVLDAQVQARSLGSEEVRPEHLLLALLARPETSAGQALAELGVRHDALARDVAAFGAADEEALQALGINLAEIRRRAEARFGPGALDRPRRQRHGLLGRWRGPQSHVRFTPAAKKALEQSLRQALTRKDRSIRCEHLLLGLVAEDNAPAARTLRRLGLAPDAVRRQVDAVVRRAA